MTFSLIFNPLLCWVEVKKRWSFSVLFEWRAKVEGSKGKGPEDQNRLKYVSVKNQIMELHWYNLKLCGLLLSHIPMYKEEKKEVEPNLEIAKGILEPWNLEWTYTSIRSIQKYSNLCETPYSFAVASISYCQNTSFLLKIVHQ